MKKGVTEENEKFNKIDKVTKIITIVICVILGAIFIATCVYMLNMINEEQIVIQDNNDTVPQNMNLVNM